MAMGQSHILIAVIGERGSGKTSFIKSFGGTSNTPNARSITQAAAGSAVPYATATHKLTNGLVTLIDGPQGRGPSSGRWNEIDALMRLQQFIEEKYGNERKLDGVIVVHRASDLLPYFTRRGFAFLKGLLHAENLDKVVIATTMWDTIDRHVEEKRELQLTQRDFFFKQAVDDGAQVMRHDNSSQSARRIVREFLNTQAPSNGVANQDDLQVGNSGVTEYGSELGNEELDRRLELAIAHVEDLVAARELRDKQTEVEIAKRSELLEKKVHMALQDIKNVVDKREADLKTANVRLEKQISDLIEAVRNHRAVLGNFQDRLGQAEVHITDKRRLEEKLAIVEETNGHLQEQLREQRDRMDALEAAIAGE